MMQFEFHAYPDAMEGSGSVAAIVTTEVLASNSAARSKAGRLAKRINGPVDLALAGGAVWHERYITTASPSEYHASGYRFERLT